MLSFSGIGINDVMLKEEQNKIKKMKSLVKIDLDSNVWILIILMDVVDETLLFQAIKIIRSCSLN